MFKPFFALPLLLATPGALTAQTTAEIQAAQARVAAAKAAMADLGNIDGVYRGTSTNFPIDGAAPIRGHVVHRVGPFLGGAVKMMEGRNYTDEGALRFNGLMIIHYDVPSKEYRVRTFANGGGGETKINRTPTGYYFDAPFEGGPAYRRINIFMRPDGWGERVDLHRPGRPPLKVFEMELKRVGDTDWPLGRPNAEPVPPTAASAAR